MSGAPIDPTLLWIAITGAFLLLLRLTRGRTYGGAFGRGAFAGVSAESPLHVPGATRPTVWIDAAERLKVEGAIREALSDSEAEVVVTVAARCRQYPEAGWRLGLFLAVAATFTIAARTPSPTLVELLAAQAAALSLGHVLCLFAPLRRLLVSARRQNEAARNRAWLRYAESGLVRSPQGAGMLLFVALFERRLVVMLGEGLAEQLGPGESAAELVIPIANAFRDDACAGARAGAALAARLCTGAHTEAGADPARPHPVALLDD